MIQLELFSRDTLKWEFCKSVLRICIHSKISIIVVKENKKTKDIISEKCCLKCLQKNGATERSCPLLIVSPTTTVKKRAHY